MSFLILHPKIKLTCLVTGCSGQPQASPHRSRACPAKFTAWLREQTRIHPLCRQVDLKREDRRDWATHAQCLLPNLSAASVTLCPLEKVKEEHTEAGSVIYFFPALLRYNWRLTLYKFKIYNMVIWQIYILWNDYHSRLRYHPHHST